MVEPLKLFCPAKINLFLHITGRRNDGYHFLESLIGFTESLGDELIFEPSNELALDVRGPFSEKVPKDESNLIFQTFRLFEDLTGEAFSSKIKLTKNLPVSAGIGGGTMNATQTLHALQTLTRVSLDQAGLEEILLKIGADAPICYDMKPALVRGVGEEIEHIPGENQRVYSIVLVNPCVSCSTKAVFEAYKNSGAPFHAGLDYGSALDNLSYFAHQDNDLEQAAIALHPAIQDCLDCLSRQEGALFARMSGSGATCFGVFETPNHAKNALMNIKVAQPEWWAAQDTIKV